MEKLVYSCDVVNNYGRTKLEIYLDINRELTEADNEVIAMNAQNIIDGLREESINLDPLIKKEAVIEKQSILSLFRDNKIFVDEIPNEYLGGLRDKFFPWFIVTTSKGRIKIGWRKRVIEIDWSDSIISATAEDLFADEDVTKDKKLIHAWGYEKAQEYIDKLLN
jgi:hypothetical protein